MLPASSIEEVLRESMPEEGTGIQRLRHFRWRRASPAAMRPGPAPSVRLFAQFETMEIIGAFHRAGVPIVAGTDNVVPVFNLYRECAALAGGGFSCQGELAGSPVRGPR